MGLRQSEMCFPANLPVMCTLQVLSEPEGVPVEKVGSRRQIQGFADDSLSRYQKVFHHVVSEVVRCRKINDTVASFSW